MTETENPTEPLPLDIREDPSVEILDVRGLEPPEPMVRTLEALQHLSVGKTLLHVNVRVPRLLLPKLAERGFSYKMREHSPDLVLVFIRRSPAEGAGLRALIASRVPNLCIELPVAPEAFDALARRRAAAHRSTWAAKLTKPQPHQQ